MWNCNSSNKTEHKYFVSILLKNNICILSESWTDEHFDFNLPEYICLNFSRKFKPINAKRNSGGLTIYIKESIKDGISIVRNHCDTLIWLKLDSLFFCSTQDIYLRALYMWPDVSPAARIYDVNLFDMLQNDVFHFESLGSIVLVGDVNAMVSLKPII